MMSFQQSKMAGSVLVALEAQVACYRTLAKLAEVQHGHVEQGRTDDLLEVLQRRQVVLDQIAVHEGAIAAAKRQWKAFVAGLPTADGAAAERLLGETKKLLGQITAVDRNDALLLQQRRIDVGRKINRATAAKSVNRTYAAAAYGRPSSRLDVQQ